MLSASAKAIALDAARLLWRRVVAQAFFDATYRQPARTRKEGGEGSRPTACEQRQARAWLTGHSPDFALVCEFAGLSANMVRRRARDLERQGWPVQELPDRGEVKRDQLASARVARIEKRMRAMRLLSEAA